MSDTGAAVGEAAAYVGAGAALAASSAAINLLTAKATLYVRMIGVSQDTTGSQINEDVSGLRSLLKARNKTSEKVAARAGQSVKSTSIMQEAASTKMTEVETAAALLSKGFLPVSVQYNPASIRMTSVGGGTKSFQAMGNENMNAMTVIDKKTATYLNAQLIYEDINNADAFGSSSFGLNTDDLIDAGKSAIVNIFGGGYSVKKPVEGLISLLMDKESRQVIFVWNNMFFHGELVSVDANFTMFNKLGNPIRATADIRILQSNGNATFASDKQYWQDAFDAVYGV